MGYWTSSYAKAKYVAPGVESISKLKAFGVKALGAAALMGVGLFLDAMIDSFRERGVKAKSKEYYEKMLEHHPQLLKEDPTTVSRYWESLMHFAPYMAKDPMAAGAYIRQSIQRGYHSEFGGPPPDTYSTLADINKKLKDNRSDLPSLAQHALKGSGVF